MIKKFFDDNRGVLFIVISLFLLVSILLSIMLYKNNKSVYQEEITTKKIEEKNKDFVGYKINKLEDKTITYNIEKKYNFIYGNKENKTINLVDDDKIYEYDIKLKDKRLIFVEELYNEKKGAFYVTGKEYVFDKGEVISFIVAPKCIKDNIGIIIMDKSNNIYVYDGTIEITIEKLLEKLEIFKTISKVKDIGYYDYNNTPYSTCENYGLIYKDEKDDIRNINKKSTLFFKDVPYGYIGDGNQDQVIYILNNGYMKYGIGKKDKYLNDGNNYIKYRGSFYTINDYGDKENIYILSEDRYLYEIENLRELSSPVLKKINNSKVLRYAYRDVINKKGFKTDYRDMKIEFEDKKIIEIKDVLAYKLLG